MSTVPSLYLVYHPVNTDRAGLMCADISVFLLVQLHIQTEEGKLRHASQDCTRTGQATSPQHDVHFGVIQHVAARPVTPGLLHGLPEPASLRGGLPF